MADVSFDISLTNNGSGSEDLTLFSPVDSASQKTNKYSYSTPYLPSYPANTLFTVLDEGGTNNLLLTSSKTMQEVVDLLSGLNAGTFLIGFNDAINGNVFHLLSTRNPISLSIDNSDYLAVAVLVGTTVLNSNAPIEFVDASTIVIGGSARALVSIDNGLSFATKVLPTSAGYSTFQVTFFDALNGFICGNDGTNSKIWVTVDAGQNWALVSTIVNTLMYGLRMTDALNGIGYRRNTILQHEVCITSDGGATFTQVQVLAGASRGTFQFVSALNGYIFQFFGNKSWKTIDGGATWSALTVPLLPVIYGGYALDTNNIWIVSDTGDIKYTANGGASWASWDISTPQPILSVFAFSTTHVIVGRQGRQYAVTVNGGASWTTTVISGGGTGTGLLFRDQYMGIGTDWGTQIYRFS